MKRYFKDEDDDVWEFEDDVNIFLYSDDPKQHGPVLHNDRYTIERLKDNWKVIEISEEEAFLWII